MNYKQYIHSEEWRELRKAAIDHYGPECSKCGKKIRIQGHHRDYTTPGIKPIQILCENCHETLHFEQKVLKWRKHTKPKISRFNRVNSGNPFPWQVRG